MAPETYFCSLLSRAGMTKSYFYKRTENYELILNRSKVGCFQVPMVHSAVLISLKSQPSEVLTYDPSKMQNYDGPEDDIIAFAVNSQNNGNEQYIVTLQYL